MLNNEQYKQDMFDGITSAFLKGTINMKEGGNLRISAKQPVNQDVMDADTYRRLNDGYNKRMKDENK